MCARISALGRRSPRSTCDRYGLETPALAANPRIEICAAIRWSRMNSPRSRTGVSTGFRTGFTSTSKLPSQQTDRTFLPEPRHVTLQPCLQLQAARLRTDEVTKVTGRGGRRDHGSRGYPGRTAQLTAGAAGWS